MELNLRLTHELPEEIIMQIQNGKALMAVVSK